MIIITKIYIIVEQKHDYLNIDKSFYSKEKAEAYINSIVQNSEYNDLFIWESELE